MLNEKSLEAKARRMAKKQGMFLHKCPRLLSVNNQSGFTLANANYGILGIGGRIDFSLEEIIYLLSEPEKVPYEY